MLPPTEWKTVKQPAGSRICVACVTAMALGETLSYVRRRMRATISADNGLPFYRTREMLRVLGGHGIYCGMMWELDGGYLERRDRLAWDVVMDGHPAVLCVPSPGAGRGRLGRDGRRVRQFHLVFWDGKWVRDPLPEVPEVMELEEYGVFEVTPLVYVDESQETYDRLVAAGREEGREGRGR